jgi:hypothetical protein
MDRSFRVDEQNSPNFVILSAVYISRSEAYTESKDPYISAVDSTLKGWLSNDIKDGVAGVSALEVSIRELLDLKALISAASAPKVGSLEISDRRILIPSALARKAVNQVASDPKVLSQRTLVRKIWSSEVWVQPISVQPVWVHSVWGPKASLQFPAAAGLTVLPRKILAVVPTAAARPAWDAESERARWRTWRE